MANPKSCPLCCRNAIRRTFKECELRLSVDGVVANTVVVAAYHCSDGHLFLTLDLNPAEVESLGSGFFTIGA